MRNAGTNIFFAGLVAVLMAGMPVGPLSAGSKSLSKKRPAVVRWVSRSLERADKQMHKTNELLKRRDVSDKKLKKSLKKIIRLQRRARGRAAAAVDWRERGASEALHLVQTTLPQHVAFFKEIEGRLQDDLKRYAQKGVIESELGIKRARRYDETLVEYRRILKDTGLLVDSPLEPVPQGELPGQGRGDIVPPDPIVTPQ